MKKLVQFTVGILIALGLAACDKPRTTATAGEKLDSATDTATKEMDSASKKTEELFDDVSVTSKARAAILNEPNLKSFQINLDTTNGVVTINGSVDNQKEKDRVNDIVSSIAGVKRTKNNIIVK